MDNIKKFIEKQGIKYKNIENYEISFLHPSYTHETKQNNESYERMEFLGDSILGKSVTEYLYLNFPQYDQGDMTLMKHFVVNKEFLAVIGKELKLHELIWLGAGEDKNNLSDSVFEDTFESLVGAIYLDAGNEEVEKFIYKHITSKLSSIDINSVKDPKTKLQELLQSETRQSVTYKTDGRSNEEKIFASKAMFNDSIIGQGQGFSKKEAEKSAAQDAIERMA
ncbi:MAG: ribonuclease III [Mycoplasmataceae bacterium]|nr:ribonuclease III [Mycoplasmataceae bacterium]